MSLLFTLSPAGPRMMGGLTRRSLMSAVNAISTTSSPNRRPLGQPPGTVPSPKPAWTELVSVSPPKMLSRENPASSGFDGWLAPPPASRAAAVERSTRIMSGMKMPAMSVRFVVGATFDESLEGITRVSVVATGIDHIAIAARPSAESRVAELTQKLRADTQRLTERIDRAEQAPRATAQTQAPAPAAPQGLARAFGAPAAALQSPAGSDDVTIRPIAPKPSLFMEPAMADPPLQDTPKAFIPPQAERPPNRTPRMPRIDELPIPAQNELRQLRGELQEEHQEKRRLTLLQRLA